MAAGGRDHLFVRGWAQRELYSQRPRPSSFAVPTRTRQTHGRKLKRQLEAALVAARKRRIGPVVSAVGAADGIYVRFESDPGFELALDSLEARRSGIELRSVRRDGEQVIATVFIPDGKVKIFLDKFERYLTEETPRGKPKHQKLVNSIKEIRLATLESLWTDDATLFPGDDDTVLWWEVWLRQDSGDELARLFAYCDAAGLTVRTRTLEFLERSVALVEATARQLVGSLDVLNDVAELRLGKQSAHEFLGLSGTGQHEAAKALLARVSAPPDDAPAVCVLDTGVNREHPLLASALSSIDMHAVEPDWLGHDDTGHGTEMAGLALYGDLSAALANDLPLQLTHRLESSKVLPPEGGNPPHLYGAITAEAIARAEANAPTRDRVSSMAITATDSRDEGQPSSWSAELDLLASGADDLETRPRRLIVVSGGNVTARPTESYFEQCVTEGIHDPGQAWNALTVGAYTELDEIQEPDFADWRALAAKGDLSPSSTTSVSWAAQWPTKPDLVMEGGNMAISPAGETDYTDSLSLLTAYHHPLIRPFVATGDTSAACALAARLAAQLYARYPNAWPETIRGLAVHSARWTQAMLSRFEPLTARRNVEAMVRCYGMGAANVRRALNSMPNAVTLIAEETIHPYEGSKMRDMHLHALPWPVATLLEHPDLNVTLRVTLSYFVDPNPGRRGWTRRHRYASHGLRFDVKTPTETPDRFRRRINVLAREQEDEKTTSSDSADWLLGPIVRHRGSVHTDMWRGSAAELAERGYIGIYPVLGWWRERHQLGRGKHGTRYSLVVSIETDDVDVDLYTPISNQIAAEIEV